MVRPCEEKDKGRYSNENMEDGSEWTAKGRKTKTEVQRCYTKNLKEKVKVVLYSAVSSPLDHSKCFTLSSPGRPVHSDTNSASLGSILAMEQLCATTKHSHFHHCL